MRAIYCQACADKAKAKPLHPEDAALGFKRRFVPIKQLKVPRGHGLTINGEFRPLSMLVCDGCNVELPAGSSAVAVTFTRGELGPWEHEYEQQPD